MRKGGLLVTHYLFCMTMIALIDYGISNLRSVQKAFAHLGVVNMTMPHSAYRVWQQLKASGVAL